MESRQSYPTSRQNVDFGALQSIRKELQSKSHLFRNETKTQWNDLEDKFRKLNSQIDADSHKRSEPRKETIQLAETIRNGYEKMRRSLS